MPSPRSAARRVAPLSSSLLLALALAVAPAAAQQRQQQEEPSRPTVALSGILFGNFQYDVGPTADVAPNQFVLDRAYLTARAAAGERASVRLTSDLFRNAGEGYDLRLKYAYLQYELLRGRAPLFVRAGMLQTVMIEQVEEFWPRWLGNVAEDRYRFFQSADLGVSAGLTLPDSLGELYATITNGRGYANAGADDRFKDYALRLTLTPLAANAGAGLLRTLAISPWYHKGDTVSAFGPQRSQGDVPPDYLGVVHTGRQRDRYGVFVGIGDPRLTVGAGLAEYRRETETGQNTSTSPIVVGRQTGRVVSAFAVARPLQLVDAALTLPLGVAVRYDRFQPVKEQDGELTFVVAGLTYDVNSRISVALDYQESLLDGLPATQYPVGQIYYAHFVARF